MGQGDSDGDTILDLCDNCPNDLHPGAYNPSQTDTDVNGVGDSCSTCVGDCNLNGSVAANEITAALLVFSGQNPLSSCILADGNADGDVMCSEFMKVIDNPFGCPHAPGPATTTGGGTVGVLLADGLNLEGVVGSTVDVPMSISGGGGAVSSVQMDLIFYGGVSIANPAEPCTISPSLASTHTLTDVVVSEPGEWPNRLRVAVMDHQKPFNTIQDGTVATCKFKIEYAEAYGHAYIFSEHEQCANAATAVMPTFPGATYIYVCPGCVCN
jgi:hypothetical protein